MISQGELVRKGLTILACALLAPHQRKLFDIVWEAIKDHVCQGSWNAGLGFSTARPGRRRVIAVRKEWLGRLPHHCTNKEQEMFLEK